MKGTKLKKVTLSIIESNVLHDIRLVGGRSKHSIIETSGLKPDDVSKALHTLQNKGLIFNVDNYYYESIDMDINVVAKANPPKMGKFKRDSHLAGIVMFFWFQRNTISFTVSQIEKYLDCSNIRKSVRELIEFLHNTGILTLEGNNINDEWLYKWSGSIEYPFPEYLPDDESLFKLRVANDDLNNSSHTVKVDTIKKPKPNEVVIGMLNMRIECLEAELANLKAMRNVLV